MLSLKHYLEEGRDAPLYHGTHPSAILHILDHGFKPMTTHHNEKLLLSPKPKSIEDRKESKGISLTRSLKFAKSWGIVVFEFDQRQLSQKYKIIPVNYWPNKPKTHDTYEYEEFLVTKKHILNLNKYIKRIHLLSVINTNNFFDELKLIQDLGIEIVKF